MKKKDLVLGTEYAFSTEREPHKYTAYHATVVDLDEWREVELWGFQRSVEREFEVDGKTITTSRFERAGDYTAGGAKRVLVRFTRTAPGWSTPLGKDEEGNTYGAVLPRHLISLWPDYVEARRAYLDYEEGRKNSIKEAREHANAVTNEASTVLGVPFTPVSISNAQISITDLAALIHRLKGEGLA